jgi:hypothetical protein
MLPKKFRFELFDRMSVKTMRYVTAISRRDATGLVADIYDQVSKDFFINGSITSHSKVPELMAGMWTLGRESILVNDKVSRTLKEAMGAILSRINDCPYCGDMFVSLVHGGGEHDVASLILSGEENQIRDPLVRAQLQWAVAAATGEREKLAQSPFTEAQMPEALSTLMMSCYVNRFSHVVMDGSPVVPLFGLHRIKDAMLRMFGTELKTTTERDITPGLALDLLPAAPIPNDLAWAASNPRIQNGIARWAAAINRETPRAVPAAVRDLVQTSLGQWQGERMPISRSWVDGETADLTGRDRAMARLALVIGKASYQVDDGMVQEVLDHGCDEETLIRLLAWASFTAARRIAENTAQATVAMRPGLAVAA